MEGDCLLAEASNAIIIGFNVVCEEHVARIAESKGIEIRFYNVIYQITEDLRKSMVGLLKPEEKEKPVGRAVVRTIFKISKVGTVAGCYVSDGLATGLHGSVLSGLSTGPMTCRETRQSSLK